MSEPGDLHPQLLRATVAPPSPVPPRPLPLPDDDPRRLHHGRQRGWRRAMAVVAVLAVVLAGGALLGNASRSGSPFSDNPTAAPGATAPATNPSGASSVTPNGSSNPAGSVADGLVNITTTLAGGEGQGAGSGMIISKSGEVLTNNHVIEGSETIRVEIVSTGATKTANVIGYDIDDDVALLEIENVSRLDTVPIGDPDNVGVDDSIVVMGNALGRGGEPNAAAGTVTGLNREITATDASGGNAETLSNMIQVEADVQPGHSGGPLVSSDGKVIGMTTAASARNFRFREVTAGIGFAIRIDKALSIAQAIRTGREGDGVHVGSRALLGVSLQDTSAFDQRNRGSSSTGSSGAFVLDVASGSPADDAGIRAGDVIVSIGGEPITSNADLLDVMNRYHADERAEVRWIDGSGSERRATVTFVEGPPA